MARVAVELERDAASAHPAVLPRGVSIDQSVIGDIVGHHRTGAYESIKADGGSTNHCGIGAERRALADQRGLVFTSANNVASRVHYVGEDHRGSAEYVVF